MHNQRQPQTRLRGRNKKCFWPKPTPIQPAQDHAHHRSRHARPDFGRGCEQLHQASGKLVRSLGQRAQQFAVLAENNVTGFLKRKFFTQPRFCTRTLASHFLGEQNKKLLLLLHGQFFDLPHDFSGTHDIKLTAILRASKPANLRQLRRQPAGNRTRRRLFRFGVEMLQFLAFAHEARAVENHDERTDVVQNGRGNGSEITK